MATPSSSATSASPPMAYLQPNTITPTTDSLGMEPVEREKRKKAVQKFLARAEISMITRALRARLSYASYKATHNIPHTSLCDLETQTQNQTIPTPRAITTTKRKAGGNNYYNNPATQGGGGASGSTSRRGVMAPPPLTASPSRSHSSTNNGNANRSANIAPSLYASILSPPPTKQARTIHNPSDPPVAPPSRPTATPRSRKDSKSSDTRPVRSIAEGTRAQAKSRREEKSPEKRKDKPSVKGKHKERFSHPTSKGPGDDVDMKAVATLTSLLMHSRPSMPATTSSPRSAHSDTGSNNSYSHFAQSSTRTTTSSASTTTSSDASLTLSHGRSSTPPSGQLTSRSHLGNVTPKASNLPHAPADSEAADHLLFLASSPSPARPTTGRSKDAKDMAAFRALGGSAGLRATARVLFPGVDTGNDPDKILAKTGENSFALSMSSIGNDLAPGELGGRSSIEPNARQSSGVGGDGPTSFIQTVFNPQQLLPPPPSPSSKPANSDSSYQALLATSWPSFSSADQKSTPKGPHTPGNVPFNFNDFINVSPSPAAPSPRHKNTSGQLKSGLSSNLRSEVRRKLFEENESIDESQLKTHGDLEMPPIGFEKPRGQGVGEDFEEETQRRAGSLGAGIDLVQT